MIRNNVPAEYSQYKQTLLAEKRKWLDSPAAFCIIYNIMRICLNAKQMPLTEFSFKFRREQMPVPSLCEGELDGKIFTLEINGHPSALIREQVSLEQDDRHDLEIDFRRIHCS